MCDKNLKSTQRLIMSNQDSYQLTFSSINFLINQLYSSLAWLIATFKTFCLVSYRFGVCTQINMPKRLRCHEWGWLIGTMTKMHNRWLAQWPIGTNSLFLTDYRWLPTPPTPSNSSQLPTWTQAWQKEFLLVYLLPEFLYMMNNR